MKNKQVVTGIVGVVIGLILGFFLSEILLQKDADVKQGFSMGQKQSGEIPEGHPSSETIERLQKLEVLAESSPDEKDARIALGNTYYDMGRFDIAIRWYVEALELEPGNISVRTDLATSYLYIGNTIRAVELYKESLKIDPNHAQTLQNIGVAYFSTGNFSEAIESWEKLIRLHPSYPNREGIEKQIQKARTHIEGDRS